MNILALVILCCCAIHTARAGWRTPVKTSGGVFTSGFAASSWDNGREDLFVRGTDGALYHSYWTGSGWSTWESLGGIITSAPAAVSWGKNRIDVFARGSDSALWYKSWTGSSWGTWVSLGGVLSSDPTVVSTSANHLDVFAKGTDQALYHIKYDGVWSNWVSLGGWLDSAPAAASCNQSRIDVFARGNNQQLVQITWNGVSWSSWINLGPLGPGENPHVESSNVGLLTIIAKTTTFQVKMKTYNSVWSDWSVVPSISTAVEPTLVSEAPLKMRILYVSFLGEQYHIDNDGLMALGDEGLNIRNPPPSPPKAFEPEFYPVIGAVVGVVFVVLIAVVAVVYVLKKPNTDSLTKNFIPSENN